MGTGQDLYKKAKKIIPGGTQLLSKRPEMFLPELWPSYYSKAKGCEVWDLDDNKFVDMCYMGIGSCILGYADDDVDEAVKNAINKGSMATLNAPEEVYLAELLCELHPWAHMVRYARTGGEAMAIAVRIARAKTRRDKVLFCGYHGWQDWYISANLADDEALDGHLISGLEPCGVPRALKNTAFPFNYNDTNRFLELIQEHKDEVAAVVVEPIRNSMPNEDFFKTIREVTKELGIVLIVDEITAGWRLNVGGAHLLFEYEPDIAVFAKGVSNGYPMSIILGREETMQAAQKSFISSTYWTDRVGPVAALSTISKIKEHKVPQHLERMGQLIQKGWKECAVKNELDITVGGIFPLSSFSFNYKDSLSLKTLFVQLMLEEGFLASNSFYASYAHKEANVNHYLKAVDKVFGIIKEIIEAGDVNSRLKGPICHDGFERLT